MIHDKIITAAPGIHFPLLSPKTIFRNISPLRIMDPDALLQCVREINESVRKLTLNAPNITVLYGSLTSVDLGAAP